MGRHFKPELKTVISVYLPVSIVAKMDEATDNRSRFIEGVLRESMDLVVAEQVEVELAELEAQQKVTEAMILRLQKLLERLKEKPIDKLEKALGDVPVE